MTHKKTKDELDLSSSNFNPLKALNNPEKVKIPVPSAPVYDNISSFVETPEGVFPKPKREPKKNKSEALVKTESKEEWNKESEIKEETKVKTKTPKNVITRMEGIIAGPLTFIKKCMDEKLRVKVYTRGAVQIRGFCLGFIIAFDKHLNLVLRDVFETWTRKRKRKVPFLGPVPVTEETDSENYNTNYMLKNLKLENTTVKKQSNTIIRKRLKRREICERHVDQLLIRGEQIVTVMLAS